MTVQIEVPKAVGYALVGPTSAEIAAVKVVAYVLLIPGESDGDDGATPQAHVHAQIIRRS